VRIAHVDSHNSEQLITEDLVGWGTALYPEGQSATYAPAGNSLVRKISDGGTYIDTDNNKNDFDISFAPSPESDNSAPNVTVDPVATEEDPIDLPNQEPQPTEETELPLVPEIPQQPESTQTVKEAAQETNVAVEITELLPDPISPATDANDEYVELHNLSDQPIELNNFKLQTGNSYTYSYTISGQVLLPNGYMVLYSEQSGLVLSNSGSRARLISPNGSVISETDSYVNAKPGQAWSLVNGVWTWTTSPTAGNDNILTVPLTVTKTATTNKTSKPKAAKKVVTAKKKQTAKPKTAKAQKAKKDKTAVIGATTSGNGEGGGSSSIHRWVIAGLGLLAVGYALYEYKDDIASKFRQFRTNRANSRKPRTAS
jgi:outer membrane biosynthesis protein TonB